ncbi:MAG: methyltransferase domain-containing protein [Paludibacterium sp.]|uniref:class I SAM-dependent methyltransferase n=1 Tax=Paludibacterium sp. TaxID=1917523 RepID=UPI0025D02E96|nr:methyltransferase domain-containing protein [Paludibacterium sp.]MBV8045607.1 methyltransferase domain-containing protein [Paludibacterium sp.]MBV8647679.1 methyltransferase domain-containing protein [Paludibacterium sp.]
MAWHTPFDISSVVGWMMTAGARCRSVMGRQVVEWRAASPGLFLREWLARPGTVGAVWPSSSGLARRMAACVPRGGAGLVVELGGGTGAVTAALQARGIASQRLWVVERSPAFAHHLRRRFPTLNVVQGDAARLAERLPRGATVDVIVSSLPLLSLPAAEADAIVAAWRRVLPPGGTLIQFSYALRDRAGVPFEGFVQQGSHLIWYNMPPARVRVYVRGD